MTWTIRAATDSDAAACAAIYAPYVTETAITFEIEPPDATEMGQRIATATASHAWLVLEDADVVAGYAYGRPFHQRAAYRWACETSIYLDMDRRPRAPATRGWRRRLRSAGPSRPHRAVRSRR